MIKNIENKKLKHYLLISFNQKPNNFRTFMNKVFVSNDNIIRYEYFKRNNKKYGKVLIEIELQNSKDLSEIIDNMKKFNFNFIKINPDDY